MRPKVGLLCRSLVLLTANDKKINICYKKWQLAYGIAKYGGAMETTVDRFGRIVIPKKIRDDFNLDPGTQVRIEEKGDAIILKPVHGEQNLQMKDGVLVYTGVPMGDLAEAVSKHREERNRLVRRLK